MGSGTDPKYRRRIGRLILGAGALTMASSVASAQTSQQWATDICSTAGMNMLIGIVYVIFGISVLALVGSVAGGVTAKSVGWASRSLSQAGNSGIVMGFAGGIILLVVVGVLGLATGAMPINIPTECMIPL